MMIGLGMTLVPEDFKRVFVFHKAAASGLFFQMIILRLTGFLLASLLPIRPEFAVGIMLLAACPGGVAPNIITHLAKGDTALAVTLTVISSSFAVVTIPFKINFSVGHFLGANSSIQLPLGETLLKVFLLTVPTVAAGMFIKKRAGAFEKKTEKFVNLGGLAFLLIIISGIIIHERNNVFGWALQVGPNVVAEKILHTSLGSKMERITGGTLSGIMTTMGYLFPRLKRAMKPLEAGQGRKNREMLRQKRDQVMTD